MRDNNVKILFSNAFCLLSRIVTLQRCSLKKVLFEPRTHIRFEQERLAI